MESKRERDLFLFHSYSVFSYLDLEAIVYGINVD